MELGDLMVGTFKRTEYLENSTGMVSGGAVSTASAS